MIRAESIGDVTIKGEGYLKFIQPKNVWLHGINFEFKTEDEESNVLFEDAENCRIARCDFHTK